jgi:hypothetical protein
MGKILNTFKKLVLFIGTGLALLLPGEVLNNLIINFASSGLVGFLVTAGFDTVLLSIAFLLWHFLGRKRDIVLLFILFGIFGLLVERTVLNHSDTGMISQLAMFTYWGSMFLAPYMLILADDVSKKTKKYFWKYLIISPFVYIVAPLAYYSILPIVAPNPMSSNGYFSLFILSSIEIFSWSLIALNIFYLPYFKKLWERHA